MIDGESEGGTMMRWCIY